MDFFWDSSFFFREHTQPNWSGFMTQYSAGNHPGKSNFFFLPIIDLILSDPSRILTTLEFVIDQAKSLNVETPMINFDQPLWIKATEIPTAFDDELHGKYRNLNKRVWFRRGTDNLLWIKYPWACDYRQNLCLAPLSRKFPELSRISNKCSPFSKKFVNTKNTKPANGRKVRSFQQELGKTDPRSGRFICSKGVRDTILECLSAKDHSKTSDNVQNTGIVIKSGDYGNSGQRSHNKVEHQFPDQFLSNILLVKKKDGGNRPCINLKALNKFTPYKHFKMKVLHCLKYLLKKNDFLCKIHLKDAYFSVSLYMSSRKFVRFAWLGNLYEFVSLCFRLGPAPSHKNKRRFKRDKPWKINQQLVRLNRLLTEEINKKILTLLVCRNHSLVSANCSLVSLNRVLIK